jgi:sirohydrochlorin cobaltochelatase
MAQSCHRRNRALSARKKPVQVAVLVAAHGERTPGAQNENARRVVQALSASDLVAEIGVGFISGKPSIADALAALKSPRIIVYPLFASSGYFSRDRLVQLLDEGNRQRRELELLTPLGLDPGMPEFVMARASEVAHVHGFAPEASTVILLAHGSRRNSASREATEGVAREIESRVIFRNVRIARLEEHPFLHAAADGVAGPGVVVGLFSGEGLHGARDAPRLVAELVRNDVAYAGVVGSMAGIEDLVVRSVERALAADLCASRRTPE